jgi:hypothetical protein
MREPTRSSSLALLIVPRHEKQSIPIRVLQTNETSSPTFIPWLAYFDAAALHSSMKFVHVDDTQNKMNATSTLEHGFQLLDQANT